MTQETEEKRNLLELERRHSWHPFTQMTQWCDPGYEPLIITSGSGVWLRDIEGKSYIDGNASIWTNIHGHNHPRINAAICAQLENIAHCSYLGSTHPGAIELASRLVNLWAPSDLSRVFFSDDGSTAIEAAIKMAVQYWQLKGQGHRNLFVSLDHAYHGDTTGASSLGGLPMYRDRFDALHFAVRRLPDVDSLVAMSDGEALNIAAVVIEPLIQGAAGMRLWPKGALKKLRDWCDRTGTLLIADEVMTGFGRTGQMFACQHEDVAPDLVALAKGLTGGYMPLAATLVSERIFEAFLGQAADGRAFLYGHSYTANPLGCAAALASLDVFEDEKTLERLPPKVELMRMLLSTMGEGNDNILEVRQCGLIAGIELCKSKERREHFNPAARTGAAVCHAARQHGLLTRPIGDVVVLMPPLCIGEHEMLQAVQAISLAIREVCG